MAASAWLIASDFAIAFMWTWSGPVIKMLVSDVLGIVQKPFDETVMVLLSIINMFAFAFFGKATNGGAYNPLTVLSSAFSRDFDFFLFTVGARIPAQVFGSVMGVQYITKLFPEVGLGPRLHVGILDGAIAEGLATFLIVVISLELARKIPKSFFRKTWISSLCKLALQVLASDITGGCMNPASVMGWAFTRGDHLTKEHVLVYWLAPVQATLLAVCIFKLLPPWKQEEESMK